MRDRENDCEEQESGFVVIFREERCAETLYIYSSFLSSTGVRGT